MRALVTGGTGFIGSQVVRKLLDDNHHIRIFSRGVVNADIFEGRSVDKSVEIRMRLRPAFPMDLLVRTPEKVRERIEMGDSFMREILDQGKVLYEAAATPLTYLAVNFLKRREAVDAFDTRTDFNPFATNSLT